MDAPAPDLDSLLRRFRSTRSPEDFAALFDAASPGLFRAAVRLTRDGAAAEDVLQETFLAVLRGVEGYDPARPALPWLTGVLQRRAADAWRRGERDRRPLPRVEEGAADPASDAARNEERALVREALEDLEEPCRRAAVLRWRYGLEPGEIADALGENPGTVRSHLSRARERLEKRLRPSLLPALTLLPSPRGLDAVRAELLREAAALAPAAAAAAGSAVVAVTGGMLMAKKGILAAAALLLLLGGAGWFAYTGGGEGPVPRDRGTNVSYLDTLPAPPPAPPPPPLPPPPPPPADLPPPVDLDACDRDLDLFGTTVDDEGKPVPGARVAAVRFPWARSGLQPPGAHDIEEEGPATVSASDGTFVLHFTRGEQWDLRATAEGYGQGDLDHCLAGEKVVLVLRRGGACVSVRCVDEQGAPVEGVALEFQKNSDTALYGRTSFKRRGVTGADGRLSLPHLPPGGAFLKASHETLGIPDWKMLRIPAHGELLVELVMPTGRTVLGRVTDASTGSPLAGARVGSNWVMDRPVPTDADGRFRFPGWTGKDTTVLTAAADGYASMLLVVPKEGDVVFALEPAFVATGRVVDADGAPVEGARVTASGHWKGEGRSGADRCLARTDAGGGFVLRDLSYRASHDLSAEAPGHGRVSLTFEAPPQGTPFRELGDIPLGVCRTIEGRALGPDDEPLAGVQVSLMGLRPEGTGHGEPSGTQAFTPGSGDMRRTDDLGRFRFPGIAPGQWTLRLAEKGAPLVVADVDLPSDRDVLDALLRRTGRSITFLVTDAAGSPLPGITVSSDAIFPHPSVRDATSSMSIATDEEGRARYNGIPDTANRHGGTPGVRFRIQPVIGPTAPPWASVQTEPLIPAGQEVTIVLRPSSSIAGRILDPDGNPVPGLYVIAVEPDGTRIPGALGCCDAEGKFSLAVTAGTVVTLRIPGHRQLEGPPGASKSSRFLYRGELPGVAAPAEGVELRAERLDDD